MSPNREIPDGMVALLRRFGRVGSAQALNWRKRTISQKVGLRSATHRPLRL